MLEKNFKLNIKQGDICSRSFIGLNEEQSHILALLLLCINLYLVPCTLLSATRVMSNWRPQTSRPGFIVTDADLMDTLSLLLALSTLSQFVGYSDEVLDVKFLGKGDSHIVVATNSCQLKVFELLTNSCQILYGHTGQSPAEGSMCSCRSTCETSRGMFIHLQEGRKFRW